VRVLDNFGKKVRVNFHRFIQGRKSCLTGAAPSCVGKMSRRDAVLPSTHFTTSNHWHDTVRPFCILNLQAFGGLVQ
jgi:hypothetical protein